MAPISLPDAEQYDHPDTGGSQSRLVPSSLWKLIRCYSRFPSVRFGVVSVIATSVNMAIFSLLCALLPKRAFFVGMAGVIGYCSGIYINFALSRRWVFGSSHFHVGAEFAMVTVVNLIGMGLALLILLGMYDYLHINHFISYGSGLVVSFVWNYYARLYWIYRHKAPDCGPDTDAPD